MKERERERKSERERASERQSERERQREGARERERERARERACRSWSVLPAAPAPTETLPVAEKEKGNALVKVQGYLAYQKQRPF